MKIALWFLLCLAAFLVGLGAGFAAAEEPSPAAANPAASAPALSDTFSRQAWEVNGIRLEPDQVERLAQNVAKQTVLAVEKVEGLTPSAEQRAQLETIYYRTALRVYEQAVKIVAREDLADRDKETQIIDLVLNGQAYSTRQIEILFSPEQYQIYRAWELRQIEAFKTRGLWANDSQKRGRRRTR